uniref:Regulatory protein RecX n=1 Tax=candidate division WOR-3 bacterium TaxID=2052148 RepID=A0A7C4CDP5_UNCW3
MKITALKPQQRNPKRVSVFLDGAFAFGVHQETIARLGLAVGREVDRAELDRLLEEEELRKCRDYALLLLTYRARTRAELEQRLVRKGFAPGIAQRTITRLQELKLVDDARFAQGFVQDRISIGHKGRWRVRAELTKRGVGRQEIEEALRSAPDETQAARELVEQFGRRYARLEPEVRRRRLYALLARRGFAVDTIREVLRFDDAVEPTE